MNRVPQFRKSYILLVLLVIGFLSGCTSVQVRPISRSIDLKEVCIQENPRVSVPHFLSVLREGFHRHGIGTEVRSENNVDRSKCVVTYSALRSWDIGTYLSVAEIWVNKGNKNIGYAKYYLRGKGGFSLFKWQGVRTKIDPVMDELLCEYPIVDDE